MADVAEDFAAWLASQGRAANTVAAYRRDVAAYLKWRAANGGDLAAYVEEVRASRARSSADRAVVALRIFHRWRDDTTPTPELAGLPRPVATDEEPLLAEADIDRLVQAANGDTVERRRDAVVIALSYFGGLKATEAISLDVADISGDATVLTVDRDGPHERILPAVPVLSAALTRWLDARGRERLGPMTSAVLLNRRGQRLTRQGLWLVTTAVGRRAGLRDALSPNDLRRACGAHLLALGLQPAAVQAFLGHSRGPAPTSRILNERGWGSCTLSA